MSAHRIRVAGLVQGVGFRPFVWRLATELGLAGWVRNDAAGVEIAIEGGAANCERFLDTLEARAPVAARIDRIVTAAADHAGHAGFRILDSAGGRVATAIGPDGATCDACLAELFEPSDRRWRHAFITCTHCGPRYTVARGLPYDRPQTSLAPFPLCSACVAEYGDPADRRFHAETTCCPVCGPHLRLLDAAGAAAAADDPVAATLRLLAEGGVVAIKGLGGFHLACDARQAPAVARLRQRKAREEKPFAVMVANLASAEAFAEVDADAARLLSAPARPIVLLPKRVGTDGVLPGIAPGLAEIGLMLPTTPLQWLLWHEAAGRPAGLAWSRQPQALTLVMTSANPGGEPLVSGDDEALRRLAGIADAYLTHDRDIVVRCDDSLARSAAAGPRFVRRARGWTPTPIRLARIGPPTLAVGAWFKNTVCVTRGDEAFVSQHVGDLDNAATCGFLEETTAHLLRILDVTPEIVAHDLHPDFHSTRFAARLAAANNWRAVAVQHHHAHVGAVLAEHGVETAALGVALDGVGLGADGAAWGGELLRVEGAAMRRLGHLAPLPLPGGDRAAREPWRMTAAVLHRLGRGDEIERRFPEQAGAATVARMLAGGVNCPETSSAGRWFDAAAGLLGIRAAMAYEGQAAMLLEGAAARYGACEALADAWRLTADGVLDLLPLLSHLSTGTDAERGAALFHATLVAALSEWVVAAAEREKIRTVALAGGCLLNRILAAGLRRRLEAHGLDVLTAAQAPPNDGGLSLGQAWVAQRS